VGVDVVFGQRNGIAGAGIRVQGVGV